MKKKTVESSLGIKVPEPVARHIDSVLKTLPTDKRYEYRRKGSVASSTEVVGERTDVSRITTSLMDRDFEIVLPEGIERTQYDINPIVLFGHDQNKPIGKALWVKPDGNGLIAKTQYTSRPKDFVGEWLPDFAWAMVQAEVLRGRSIGFLPLEVREPTEDELAINPELQQVISRSLLLEFSLVSVPSNPLALVESIGKGIGLDHWKIEFPGKQVRKAKTPKAVNRERVLANALDGIELDSKKITDLAMKRLAEKWEI
jgi:phage head maturation protease